MRECRLSSLAWLGVLAVSLSPVCGRAQTGNPGLRPSPPYLVANFNRDIESPAVSEPREYVRLGDVLVFEFQDRLWRTDGTEAGTSPLCVPEPGGCLSIGDFLESTGEMVFLTVHSEAPFQLWRTDGTPEGTLALTNSSERRVSGHFYSYHPAAGLFFFAMSEGGGDQGDLWVTDGTPDGTHHVADITPAHAFTGLPNGGASLGPALVFGAADVDRDFELWRSDGTAEGTYQIADLEPGPQGSTPQDFHVVGDRAVFNAAQDVTSFPLWSTDGTPEGTTRLPLPRPAPGSVIAAPLGSAEDGHLYFQVAVTNEGRELWITDGTVEGTRIVAPFDSGATSTPGGNARIFESFGSRTVFAAQDPDHGRELWTTDGTSEGTGRLADLCPGPCDFAVRPLQRIGPLLYFVGDDGHSGREPWVTNGTTAGTRRLGDLCFGPCSSNPLHVVGTSSDGSLFLIADDGLHGQELWLLGNGDPRRLTDMAPTEPFLSRQGGSLEDALVFGAASLAEGLSLWRTDGTAEGTRPFLRLADVSDRGSNPRELTRIGNEVFLLAGELWKTRGTPESTREIPLPESRGVQELALLSSAGRDLAVLLVSHEGLVARELWITDGTTPATLLEDGIQRETLSRDRKLLSAGGRVFYIPHNDTAEPSELWATDGTAAGTYKLGEPRYGRGEATVFGDRLFFPAEIDEFHQVELWVSDGTPGGTAPFADLDGAVSSQPQDLVVAGSTLYFSAGDERLRRLWKSDGTPQGTVPVLPDGFSNPPRDPMPFAAAGQRLFFFSGRGSSMDALWVSDGTPEGTRSLAPIDLFGSFREEHVATVGDTLFTIFHEFNRDPRLWSSDGTLDGTGPSSLLPPDLEPLSLATVEDHLLITGRRDTFSQLVELWWSDGTPEGTILVDVFREPPPASFVSLGDRVVFSAADEDTGTELWGFDLTREGPPTTAPPAAPADLTAEAIPASFREIRLTWLDRSTDETAFEIRARTVLGAPEVVAVTPANTEVFTLSADDPFPYTYEVRAVGPGGASDWSNEASAMPLEVGSTGPCIALEKRLCLLGNRFQVEVYWRDDVNGGSDYARAVPFDFSDDSGTFWFFDPANVELVVKVLNARPVNGRFWVFYGALSNVEYWITVTDTQTQRNVTYHNPPGEVCGSGDTAAFPRTPLDAVSTPPRPPDRTVAGVPWDNASGPGVARPVRTAEGAGTTDCTAGETALCLSRNRFRVEVEWTDPRTGDTGVGHAIPGSDDSGFFWFFDPANVELVTKLLDARTVNGNFWFFYGGLSDVEYTITVTDVVTEQQRVYTNAPGDICGQADTGAFLGDSSP